MLRPPPFLRRVGLRIVLLGLVFHELCIGIGQTSEPWPSVARLGDGQALAELPQRLVRHALRQIGIPDDEVSPLDQIGRT